MNKFIHNHQIYYSIIDVQECLEIDLDDALNNIPELHKIKHNQVYFCTFTGLVQGLSATGSKIDLVYLAELIIPDRKIYRKLMTLGEVAKALNTGRNKLFKFLKQKGIILFNNLPKQEFINKGYFQVISKSWAVEYNGARLWNVYGQTQCTYKGYQFISNLLQIVNNI